MSSKARSTRLYLLMVWQEQSGELERAIWRFRLEDARSGRQELFSDAGSMIAALLAIASTPDESEQQEERGDD